MLASHPYYPSPPSSPFSYKDSPPIFKSSQKACQYFLIHSYGTASHPHFPVLSELSPFSHFLLHLQRLPIPHFPFHLQGLTPLSRPLKRLAHTFRSTPTPLDSVVFLVFFCSQFIIKPINICIDKYVHKFSYICCVLFNLVLSRLVCLLPTRIVSGPITFKLMVD